MQAFNLDCCAPLGLAVFRAGIVVLFIAKDAAMKASALPSVNFGAFAIRSGRWPLSAATSACAITGQRRTKAIPESANSEPGSFKDIHPEHRTVLQAESGQSLCHLSECTMERICIMPIGARVSPFSSFTDGASALQCGSIRYLHSSRAADVVSCTINGVVDDPIILVEAMSFLPSPMTWRSSSSALT